MSGYNIYSGSDVSFNGVTGLAFDSSGTLYSVNYYQGTTTASGLFNKTTSQGNSSNVATFDVSSSMYGLVYNPSESLFYLANKQAQSIQSVDGSGSNLTNVVTAGLSSPYGLAYNSDYSILCCSNNGNNTISKIDASNGTASLFSDGSSLDSDASLNSPTGLVFDSSGTLYCANVGNSTVVKIDASGNVRTYAPASGSISLTNPIGLAFDSNGTLYCSNSSNNNPSIVKIDASGVVTAYNNTFVGSTTYFLTMKDDYLYFGVESGTIRVTTTPLCFNEDTKILCFNSNSLKEEYIPIQDLKKGDLVKTYLHGYRRVDLTHTGVLFNNPNNWRNTMYKMEKTEENGLLEDLIVTGGHSILVDSISQEEQERLDKLGLSDFPVKYKFDNKYLLLASVSDHFIPLTDNKKYTYYHLTLESDGDDNQQFGIWANGVLTETTCKNYLLNHV